MYYPFPIFTTNPNISDYFERLLTNIADFGARFGAGAEIITRMFFAPMTELADRYPILKGHAFVLNLLGLSNFNMIELMFLFGFGTYVSFTLMKYLTDLVN